MSSVALGLQPHWGVRLRDTACADVFTALAEDVAPTVAGWKASATAHQDLQFAGGAVEVKTTAAKQPQSVRITSERQLDDTGVGALVLHVVVVGEREVPTGAIAPGQSPSALTAER